MEKLEYFRRLSEFGAALPGRSIATADLDYFCDHIIKNPDHIRRLVFGANILRRQRLDDKQRAWLRTLDVHPDLLSPLNELRYEPSYTRLLGYFLDQHRSILSPHLLDSFLQVVGVSIAPSEYGEVRIECEYALPSDTAGRVDLVISTPSLLIYVENKVDSSAGPNQLTRYHKALENELGDRDGTLVYLTLPDHEPPDTKAPYKHITFDDVLVAWLPFAVGTYPDCNYLARFLKSIAILLGRAAPRDFEDWSFGTQRAALELIEEVSVDENSR
jgi:hypothetical protein